jgi:hypothetical protein
MIADSGLRGWAVFNVGLVVKKTLAWIFRSQMMIFIISYGNSFHIWAKTLAHWVAVYPQVSCRVWRMTKAHGVSPPCIKKAPAKTRSPCTREHCAAEFSPTCFTHEPVPLQALGPPEPTTTCLGSNSTQKTSLVGEDCPPPICCAPPSSISDVGLNLTISPITHWA